MQKIEQKTEKLKYKNLINAISILIPVVVAILLVPVRSRAFVSALRSRSGVAATKLSSV